MLRRHRDLLAVDLGKLALRGLLNRNPELDPKDVDYLLFGTVIQVHTTAARPSGVLVSQAVHTCMHGLRFRFILVRNVI